MHHNGVCQHDSMQAAWRGPAELPERQRRRQWRQLTQWQRCSARGQCKTPLAARCGQAGGSQPLPLTEPASSSSSSASSAAAAACRSHSHAPSSMAVASASCLGREAAWWLLLSSYALCSLRGVSRQEVKALGCDCWHEPVSHSPTSRAPCPGRPEAHHLLVNSRMAVVRASSMPKRRMSVGHSSMSGSLGKDQLAFGKASGTRGAVPPAAAATLTGLAQHAVHVGC